jgi:hypothetical protein
VLAYLVRDESFGRHTFAAPPTTYLTVEAPPGPIPGSPAGQIMNDPLRESEDTVVRGAIGIFQTHIERGLTIRTKLQVKHLHEADADRDSGIDDYASYQDDHFVDCLIEVKKLPPRRRFLDVITDAADDILTSSDHRCFRLFRSEKTCLILSSFVLWISALTLPRLQTLDLGQPDDGRGTRTSTFEPK